MRGSLQHAIVKSYPGHHTRDGQRRQCRYHLLQSALLPEITRTFHLSPSPGGAMAVATQLGFAAGNLFVPPLGDVVECGKLILRHFAAFMTYNAAVLIATLNSGE